MIALPRCKHIDELRGIVVMMETVPAWTLLDLLIEMGAITHQEAWHALSANLNEGGPE